MRTEPGTIETRIQRSLRRLGCNDVQVKTAANGHVELIAENASAEERSTALAIVKTVPGVISVTL
jgi:nitrate reductase NapAB chaperone NapD